MASPTTNNHVALVQRIKSVREALQAEVNPEKRNVRLDELGAATSELAELILKREGKLKSPIE